MRIQYAALNDLESVITDLTKLGKGRLVLFFDSKQGWVATDEVELLPSKEGPGSFEFRAKAYGDWVRPHVANAVSALGAVRFLPASDMDKLFRKPVPIAAGAQGMGATQGPAPVAGGGKTIEAQRAAGSSAERAKNGAPGTGAAAPKQQPGAKKR